MLRRAFTLIEIVYVVAAECAVVTLGIGVLFMATEARIKEYRDDAARMAAPRLAESFRNDLRSAVSAELDEFNENLLHLTLPGSERIEYVIRHAKQPKKSVIQRTRLRDGQRPESETFYLPENSTAWFVQGEGDDAGIFALNIWTAPVDRRDQALVPMPDKKQLNPFTREFTDKNTGRDFHPRDAANWRTIYGKLSTTPI